MTSKYPLKSVRINDVQNVRYLTLLQIIKEVEMKHGEREIERSAALQKYIAYFAVHYKQLQLLVSAFRKYRVQ